LTKELKFCKDVDKAAPMSATSKALFRAPAILFNSSLVSAPMMSRAQLIESGAGPTAADITPARDQFRIDLGGGTVAGPNGSFGGLRREINWDGVPAAFAAPSNLPAKCF
jgi:hypothetical protein